MWKGEDKQSWSNAAALSALLIGLHGPRLSCFTEADSEIQVHYSDWPVLPFSTCLPALTAVNPDLGAQIQTFAFVLVKDYARSLI